MAVSNMTKPSNRVPSDHDRMTNRKSKAFFITPPPPPLIHGAVEVKQKSLKSCGGTFFRTGVVEK